MYVGKYLHEYSKDNNMLTLECSNDGRRDNSAYDYQWMLYPRTSLIDLNENGSMLWLNAKSKYEFQMSCNAKIEEVSANALKDVLHQINRTSLDENLEEGSHLASALRKMDLLTVTDVKYNPLVNHMFYRNSNYGFTRNLYKPSEYLKYGHSRIHKECPEVYKRVLKALSGDEKDGVEYIKNDFSRFFQTFKVSKKYIIFNGYNTEVTDILFEYVFEPLFGKNNAIRIDDEELDKEFLSKTENKLLVNINKIPSDASNLKAMNKQLEKLIKNQASYQMIVFTTNELNGINIYRNSNDYTVFTPSDISDDYLGYGSYSSLGKALVEDLEAFAGYMYHLNFDKELIKNSLPTTAKDIVLASPINRVDTFIKAIQTKDLYYFESLNNTVYTELYIKLKEDIYRDVISKSSLTDLFNALENTDFSAKAFLAKLRSSSKLNKIFFDKKNSKGVDSGDELYIIASEYNEYFTMLE